MRRFFFWHCWLPLHPIVCVCVLVCARLRMCAWAGYWCVYAICVIASRHSEEQTSANTQFVDVSTYAWWLCSAMLNATANRFCFHINGWIHIHFKLLTIAFAYTRAIVHTQTDIRSRARTPPQPMRVWEGEMRDMSLCLLFATSPLAPLAVTLCRALTHSSVSRPRLLLASELNNYNYTRRTPHAAAFKGIRFVSFVFCLIKSTQSIVSFSISTDIFCAAFRLHTQIVIWIIWMFGCTVGRVCVCMRRRRIRYLHVN